MNNKKCAFNQIMFGGTLLNHENAKLGFKRKTWFQGKATGFQASLQKIR